MKKRVHIYPSKYRLSFLIMIALLIGLNIYFNSRAFLGTSTGAVSDAYSTLITPAGYAFAIWGLIYFALGWFAIFQLRRGKDVGLYLRLWPWFLVNVVSNLLWLVVFQLEWILMSLAVMLVVFFTLLKIYSLFFSRLRALNTTQRYFLQVPVSLYFSWICVALTINTAVWLQTLKLTLFEGAPQFWTILILAVITLIGIFMLFKFKDYLFPLVFAWALYAIGVGQTDIVAIETVAKSAAGLLAVIAGIKLLQFFRTRYEVKGRSLNSRNVV